MSEPGRRLSALLFGLAAVCGCDGKPSVDTSLTEARVSGTVRVKGVPAEGGAVLFNPSNSERIVPTRTAPIGKDGTYSLTTLTGGNQVSFEGDVAAKNRGVGLVKEFVEVVGGDQQADFDLMGENSGKQRPAFNLPEKGKRKAGAPK